MAIKIGDQLFKLDIDPSLLSSLRSMLTSLAPDIGGGTAAFLSAFAEQFEQLIDSWREWDLLVDRTLAQLESNGYPQAVLQQQLTDEQLGLLIRDVVALDEGGTRSLDKGATVQFLLKVTCQEWFKRSLIEKLSMVDHLRNRTAIMEEAHEHHCQSRYISSIPLLLMQFDGILTSNMLVTGEAFREATTKGRHVIMSTRTKNRRLTNLDRKLGDSSLRGHEYMKGTTELILNVVTQERNEILHGEKVDYGTPERSLKLLFFTDALLRAIISSNRQTETG